MIEPGRPEKLTDVELVEALDLGASRIRMAAAGDLRHVGDALAGLALEAGRRLEARARLAIAGPLDGTIRDVRIDDGGRLTARLEVNLR